MLSRIPTPATKFGRTILGVALIIGGIFGFLPVLGFWMIPLGLIILSQDFASVRRFRRRMQVKLSRWWERRRGRSNGGEGGEGGEGGGEGGGGNGEGNGRTARRRRRRRQRKTPAQGPAL